MKKVRVLTIILLLSALLLMPYLQAQTNNTNNTSGSNTGSNNAPANDKEKIELAFTCLEEKTGNCASISTQELALTILATPDENFDECVDELEGRASENNFGNVRDTALAILALDHAGKDTDNYEEWLKNQEKNPSQLLWYLQQDSNEASQCSISYNTNSYTINIGTNKKISTDAGSCLTRAQSNFWLQVAPGCYDSDFLVQCDKQFITNFIYKNKDSSTVYVLENTETAPAYGTINMSLKSKCFGNGATCNYEATAWAALALLETGHTIDSYIPYLIALADTNEQYLPNAFIYLTTDYEDYANKLLEEQKLGNYWQAERSIYGRYYDTALALISLGRTSSSEKVTNAKKQLLFSQGSNGCWANSIRDTAIVLWALEGRSGRSGGSGGGSVTTCGEANFYCIPTSECPSGETLPNFYCSGLSNTCCKTENLQTCDAQQGTVCSNGEVCSGNVRKASDASACCLGTCQQPNTQTECEENGYVCRTSSCSSRQEEVPLVCNQGAVCCKTKTEDPKGSSWTVIILLSILILLVTLAIIFRKKLGLWWFAIKTKFKKDKGKAGSQTGGMPPRGPPGRPLPPRGRPMMRRPLPPPRGPPGRPLPPNNQTKNSPGRNKEFDDTFSKLRGYTK